jgi:hypothetical protein
MSSSTWCAAAEATLANGCGSLECAAAYAQRLFALAYRSCALASLASQLGHLSHSEQEPQKVDCMLHESYYDHWSLHGGGGINGWLLRVDVGYLVFLGPRGFEQQDDVATDGCCQPGQSHFAIVRWIRPCRVLACL